MAGSRGWEDSFFKTVEKNQNLTQTSFIFLQRFLNISECNDEALFYNNEMAHNNSNNSCDLSVRCIRPRSKRGTLYK